MDLALVDPQVEFYNYDNKNFYPYINPGWLSWSVTWALPRVDSQIKIFNYNNNHFYFMLTRLTLLPLDLGLTLGKPQNQVLKLW
jgi:hypothetical protein